MDAFEKLLRLGLKDVQEREVVHVLVDCCLQVRNYLWYRLIDLSGLVDCYHVQLYQVDLVGSCEVGLNLIHPIGNGLKKQKSMCIV